MAREQRVANEALYDHLWAQLPLHPHSDWPLWDSLSRELDGGRCLELGDGVLPRIPVAGGLLKLSLRMPRLLLWMKRSAVKNQLARHLDWRTDDVADGHREGGFIGIFRRRAQAA